MTANQNAPVIERQISPEEVWFKGSKPNRIACEVSELEGARLVKRNLSTGERYVLVPGGKRVRRELFKAQVYLPENEITSWKAEFEGITYVIIND